MATTSITPDMETNVTGVERAEEQRFQHAGDSKATTIPTTRPSSATRRLCTTTVRRTDDLFAPSAIRTAPSQLRSGAASEQRAAWVSRDNSSHRSTPAWTGNW